MINDRQLVETFSSVSTKIVEREISDFRANRSQSHAQMSNLEAKVFGKHPKGLESGLSCKSDRQNYLNQFHLKKFVHV